MRVRVASSHSPRAAGSAAREAMMAPAMNPAAMHPAHPAPAGPNAPTIGAVTTRLTVTVPQGIAGGDLVRVAAPDGSFHSIMVPGGLASGQQFSVELLAMNSSAELQKLRVRSAADPPLPAGGARCSPANPTAARAARARRGARASARDAARGHAPPRSSRADAGEAGGRPRLLPRHAEAAAAVHRHAALAGRDAGQ